MPQCIKRALQLHFYYLKTYLLSSNSTNANGDRPAPRLSYESLLTFKSTSKMCPYLSKMSLISLSITSGGRLPTYTRRSLVPAGPLSTSRLIVFRYWYSGDGAIWSTCLIEKNQDNENNTQWEIFGKPVLFYKTLTHENYYANASFSCIIAILKVKIVPCNFLVHQQSSPIPTKCRFQCRWSTDYVHQCTQSTIYGKFTIPY